MHFFQAQLAVQDNRANGKKSFPGRVPGQKKEPKWFQNLGRFQKEFFCSAAKKSPKNWTGPWLSLNMVTETSSASGKHLCEMPNVRFKVRTQRRPAQFSRAATASQDDRIETSTVGGL